MGQLGLSLSFEGLASFWILVHVISVVVRARVVRIRNEGTAVLVVAGIRAEGRSGCVVPTGRANTAATRGHLTFSGGTVSTRDRSGERILWTQVHVVLRRIGVRRVVVVGWLGKPHI